MSDNTARGFLDDIVANPDDDAPRLIFADWLEDNGELPRAEFIRAQLERVPLPAWDARSVRLLLRERALLDQHSKQWLAELPRIKGVTWGEFRRGFVATAKFTDFTALGADMRACWAAAPIEAVSVRWPRKGDPSETLAPIAGLRELSIRGTLVDAGDISRLAGAPLLSTLRSLTIADANLGVEGFRRLVGSPHLQRLTALRVPRNSTGNGAMNALIESAPLPSLAELDLSETGSYGRYGEDPIIDATGMALLARWPGLARLRSLSLSGNDARQDGLRALLESPLVTGLKALAMRGNGLTGPAMEAFGAAGSGLRLDVLDLSENLLRGAGAEHLAKAPCLRELKVLLLDRCEMPQAAARQLAKAPFVATLRSLNVSYNSLGPKGLLALIGAKPPELHTLVARDVDLGDAGASVLAQSPASDVLLEVNLSGNALSDESARALAASDHLRNLLVLRMDDNPITKKAATALARSALGERLAVLEVPKAAGGVPRPRHSDDIPF